MPDLPQAGDKGKLLLRPGEYFDSSLSVSPACVLQECFKSSWKVHKVVHQRTSAGFAFLQFSIPPPTHRSLTGSSNSTYNPWPGFMFTGSLRPAPLVSLGLSRDSHVISILVDSQETSSRPYCSTRLCRRRLEISAHLASCIFFLPLIQVFLIVKKRPRELLSSNSCLPRRLRVSRLPVG